MRVDNGAAVLPKGDSRQAVKPADGVPVPMPTVHVPLPSIEVAPDAGGTDTNSFQAASVLVAGQRLWDLGFLFFL
jgi:hypothetical protein